jgi:hypothetical protein
MLSPSTGSSVPQKMMIFTLTTVRTSADLKMNSPECHLYSLNNSKKNNIFCSFVCVCQMEERL